MGKEGQAQQDTLNDDINTLLRSFVDISDVLIKADLHITHSELVCV